MFVEGKINGVPCTILVDTGAAVTIVHRRIWDRGKRTATLENNTSSVVTANGEPLKLLGKTKVVFSLAERELKHNILVTDSITQDCLLGSDFLTAHECVVDLKARKLVMGLLSTPIFHLQVTDQSQAVCRVSMSETMVFRAGEERVCVGNIDIPPLVTIGSAGVVEPKEGFEERSNLLLARTLVVPDNGCLPVRLANLTESPVTVYKGTNVAIFSPLPSDSETLVWICRFGAPYAIHSDQGRNFEERSNLLLARTLVVPDNGCLPVRLANLTESPVTVYKGTNVAIFSPLPSDSETLVSPL